MDVPPPIPNKPTRLIDQLRAFIRSRNLAYSTEKTYIHWVLRFIRFHNRQHPKALSAFHVDSFLSHLAVQRSCSASTQSTALNALVFLYREFLRQPTENLSFQHSRRAARVPVVFSHEEARQVIENLDGVNQTVAKLIYGSGLRINEAYFEKVVSLQPALATPNTQPAR